jgi:hypothetical protein
MRTPRLAIIFASLAFVTFALLYLLARRPAAKPPISIGVFSYDSWGKGPSLTVRIGITNTGRTAIRYNQVNFSGDAVLRTESRKGWTIRDIGPLAMLPLMRALLRPGSNTSAFISLPSNTLRWQVSYHVRAASLRDRVVSRIPAKWHGRLYPLCKRWLSDKEGPEKEIASDVFECPSVLKISNDEGPPIFDSDPFSPVPAAAKR